MSERPTLPLWTPQPPEPAVRQGLDRLCRAPDVVRVAVMPDVHPAAGANNGVAFATTKLIYPSGIGGDIGCFIGTVCANR